MREKTTGGRACSRGVFIYTTGGRKLPAGQPPCAEEKCLPCFFSLHELIFITTHPHLLISPILPTLAILLGENELRCL